MYAGAFAYIFTLLTAVVEAPRPQNVHCICYSPTRFGFLELRRREQSGSSFVVFSYDELTSGTSRLARPVLPVTATMKGSAKRNVCRLLQCSECAIFRFFRTRSSLYFADVGVISGAIKYIGIDFNLSTLQKVSENANY